mmetsp:Transcript_102675/g.329070  ORF Transcript_102675/g.329070 Transcript_102675/m.329070 type:complete len:127 (-) Transcript_102675:295-675(-)
MDILWNATFLRQSSHECHIGGPVVFGTDFCPSGNPYYDQIPEGTSILIAHGPAAGCADGGKGCSSLLEAVRRVKPVLVVSGHVHFAHGAAALQLPTGERTIFLNAANCGSGPKERSIAHGAIAIEL